MGRQITSRIMIMQIAAWALTFKIVGFIKGV